MELAAATKICSPAGASTQKLQTWRKRADFSPFERLKNSNLRDPQSSDGTVTRLANSRFPDCSQPHACRPLVSAASSSTLCFGGSPHAPRGAADLVPLHTSSTPSVLATRLSLHASGFILGARSRRMLKCSSGAGGADGTDDWEDHERAAREAARDLGGEEAAALGAEQGEGEEASAEHLDWRAFRARLVASEKTDARARPGEGGLGVSETMGESSGDTSRVALANLWAHALHAPEKGCLLVASELLDGYQFFHRSVILLLGVGTGPSDGPYGIALNKSFPRTVAEIDSLLPGLATTLGGNQVHVGGPMGRRTVLMVHGHDGLEGHCEVMPGVFVGGLSGLASVTEAVLAGKAKAEDFQVVLGYAGWQDKQLLNEVAQGWWYVAASNSEVILEAQKRVLEKEGDEFWRDVLQLMGGKYAEVGNRCTGEE